MNSTIYEIYLEIYEYPPPIYNICIYTHTPDEKKVADFFVIVFHSVVSSGGVTKKNGIYNI